MTDDRAKDEDEPAEEDVPEEPGEREHEIVEFPERPDKALRRVRAAALRADADPRAVSALKRFRHNLPGDPRFGDPLSTAGERTSDQVAKSVSMLEPERPSVAHEIGMAALQLWRSLTDTATGEGTEVDVALLFTDLVDFSSWSLEVGDTITIDLLRSVADELEGAIAEHGGVVVKRLGDGLMAAFMEPQEAVEAALVAQERLERVDVDGYVPRMRAGVHWGHPRKLGGDYLGIDVNVAARVGAAAGTGELLVSEGAFERLDRKGLKYTKAKRLKAAGAPADLRVRKISRADSGSEDQPGE